MSTGTTVTFRVCFVGFLVLYLMTELKCSALEGSGRHFNRNRSNMRGSYAAQTVKPLLSDILGWILSIMSSSAQECSLHPQAQPLNQNLAKKHLLGGHSGLGYWL